MTTTTRIELTYNQVMRTNDLTDLAELLFPGNPNQQHAALVIWISLKWAADGMVPNLADAAHEHSVSRRTIERVRAKMRRFGLIDHVSRFNNRHGFREGWKFSSRFERCLERLSRTTAGLKDAKQGSREKDLLLLQFAQARLTTPERKDADSENDATDAAEVSGDAD